MVFVVTLLGALTAIAWHRRRAIDSPWLAYGLPGALVVVVLAYGSGRLVTSPLGSGAATTYARLGDVFGWLCVICSVASPLVGYAQRGGT